MKRFTKKQLLLALAVLLAFGAVGGAYAFGRTTADTNDGALTSTARQGWEAATIPADSQERIDEAVAANTASSQSQTVNDKLLYLIEEEKLAHDVYQKMYELWGAKTFSNIMNSETTHQNRVLTLLQDRDIADPRSDQAGVFQDQDLQALYDKLVAQGSQSLTEAYKVGVTIEEVDIADLTADLKLVDANDTDVISVLNALKRGSENHLRAFSRHV